VYFAYRDKKVVGVFVRFRAPLQGTNVANFDNMDTKRAEKCYS
jgi:hypothetical protein